MNSAVQAAYKKAFVEVGNLILWVETLTTAKWLEVDFF